MTPAIDPTPRGAERRQSPRAKAEWDVTLELPDGPVGARLRDVSGAGLCFFVDREVPEMTLIKVALDLPLPDGVHPLRCAGAVVRCRKISPRLDHWEIAVFLHEIAPGDRALLEAHVESSDDAA
jgi:hypothetical protein